VCFKEAEDFPHVLLAFLEAGNTLKGVPHPFPDAQLHRGPCPVQLPVEALAAVKMTKRREPQHRRKRQSWTVDDARWFLESTWHAGEALYAAFVLVLVLGLRKGEILGLAWDQVDLDDAELYVGEQLQRVGRKLIRREVKTETSEAPLPLTGPVRNCFEDPQQAAGRRPGPCGRWQDRCRPGLHHPARYAD
jgi:hypothetical protein